MIKYFVANLTQRAGDVETAVRLAKEMRDNDIRAYFNHNQTDIAIEPMLIILNQQVDVLTQVPPPSQQRSVEQRREYERLHKEVTGLAKETEDLILLIQGENSEKLIDIYALYSFFSIHQNKQDEAIIYQKKANRLALEAFGELSQQYLMRLQENV